MIALFATIDLIFNIVWFLIIASAIFSWLYAFNIVNPNNQFIASIGNMLYQLTEPLLRPIRRFIPPFSGLDVSPIILLVILFFLQTFIQTTIRPAVIGY
ncbi:MAG: YggT family protein [Rhizobiales bacterium]|nr:YggT family protein [Hyphomicrobiales bacterium]